jgi:transposase InsO family protein
MTESQVTKVQKLTRNGNFRAWLMHLRAWLTTDEGHDVFLDRAPRGDDEKQLDRQARARMILCLSPEMLPIVEDTATAKQAVDALRKDHLGQAVSMRSELMTQVTGMRQGHKQSVKEYVAVGRNYLVRLREVGVDKPSTLLIPCFKAGIDSRMKQTVLPLLNQEKFETDFEALAQEFQRITVGMMGASGAGTSGAEGHGQAHTTQGESNKRKKQRNETRKCFVCGKVGHIARFCKERQGQQEPQRGPVVLLSEGNAHSSDTPPSMLFDSGATHHIVSNQEYLRKVRPPSVSVITLGGGERHDVLAEGDLMLRSPVTGLDVLLTCVLWVPGISYNLCSGAQLTTKDAVCEQRGDTLTITSGTKRTLLTGVRKNNLYYISAHMVMPTEGQAHVSLATWHARLGHPSVEMVRRMSRHQAVKGLSDAHKEKAFTCDVCIAAKQQRAAHSPSTTRAKQACELLHTDLMCPADEGLMAESSYVLTVLDDYSRYSEVKILSSKSQAAEAFIALATRMERQTGKKVKQIRFDRGKEFYRLSDWMMEQGIIAQPVPAYTPEANGRAERLNKTLIERVRALLHQFELPINLWQYAMEVSSYTRNLVPSIESDVTPHELLFNIKPDVTHLRVFGCVARVLIPKTQRSKFAAVVEEGILVGYAQYSKAWRVLVDTDSGLTIRETQNVTFDESRTSTSLRSVLIEHPDADVRDADGAQYADVRVSSLKRKNAPDPTYTATTEDTIDLLGGDDSEANVQSAEQEAAQQNAVQVEPEVGLPETNSTDPVEPSQEECEDVSHEHDNEPDSYADTERRYPLRDRRKAYDPHHPYVLLAADQNPPQTITEAQGRVDWPLWREGVNAELQSLFEKGVYDDIPKTDVPEGKQMIPSKWVFDYKTDVNGDIIGHKCRVVAKGFHQCPGVDFADTYAPTVQDSTLRLLLQYAAEWKLSIQQIDVKTAFLNGELIEEVYILPPPGLPLKGRAWRLRRSLYGLKQAALAWYEKWTKVMLSIGMKPSDADPCLFTGAVAGSRMLIGLHVDDGLLLGNNAAIKTMIGKLKAEFEIKDVGSLLPGVTLKFLGMELLRQSGPKIGIVMRQERYALSILDRFGMRNCKPVASPMVPGVKLAHEGDPLPEDNEYAAIVGSLLYLSTKTRPDISHAVGVLSRFMSCPRVPHLQAAKRVLRYIAKNPAAGIIFYGRRLEENRSPILTSSVYSDADFAGDPVMRKSTTGVVFTVNRAPILWRSKLQSIVAQSTCEAEFVAAAMAVREVLWLKRILVTLSSSVAKVNLFCDNESALALLQTSVPKVTGRTKHIDVQYWLVRDHIMKENIVPRFIPTDKMLADGLTKPYSGPEMQGYLAKIGMHEGLKE